MKSKIDYRGAPRSTMGEKIWSSVDARNFGFGYDVTVRTQHHRTTDANGTPNSPKYVKPVLPYAFVWREVLWL